MVSLSVCRLPLINQYSLETLSNVYINHIDTHCIYISATKTFNLKIHVELIKKPHIFNNYSYFIKNSKV